MVKRTVAKEDVALDEMLKREDYLVTQANDLARSFGNLTAFQHRILDFCFSYVQLKDDRRKVYKSDFRYAIGHLGLNKSGDSYERISAALRALDMKSLIYLQTYEGDGVRAITMAHLFDHVKIYSNGKFEFRFSEDVAPYIFELKKNFYSFKLSELASIRGKYALTLLKLWNANARGKWQANRLPRAIIKGSVEEWESWMLGSDEQGNPRRWPAARFKQKALNHAIDELSDKFAVTCYIKNIQDGRRVIGYRVYINPSRMKQDNNNS